jgi:GT2 family glycosyltransferase
MDDTNVVYNKDTFSVIVPTYHRPEDLRLLFKALLKQKYKPEEVIIVDDTENNSISGLCDDFFNFFEKKEIKLIYKRNIGVRSSARARNLGIKIAKSEYLLFLDSDTVLDENYIGEILKIFKEYDALGVHGWVVGPRSRIKVGFARYFSYFFNKLFLLGYSSVNSCKMYQYPRVLDKTINCEWLSGSNMTIKKSITNEFRFDRLLFKYSFSEDVLLSHSIHQKYPNSLYITPNAKLLHNASERGRMKQNNSFYDLVDSQRKYVLYRLYGLNGMPTYYRQRIGLFLLRRVLSLFFN